MKRSVDKLLLLRNKINNDNSIYYIVQIAVLVIVLLIRLPSFAPEGGIKNNISFFIFDLLVTSYWIVFSLFLAFIIFRLDSKRFEKWSGVLLFTSVFLYLLLWIPYQLNMTDPGKQLSISWFMLKEGDLISNNPYKWGGWLVNGLWLSIPGKPFVLWARLGYVLVISFSALFAYKTISIYYKNILTFIGVLITTIFITCYNANPIINHRNLPVLFVLIALFFLAKYLFEDHKLIFNFLSGLFFVLAVFSRLPLIVVAFFPLVFFVISYFLKKDRNLTSDILVHYAGGIFCFIIGLFVLSIKGEASDYLGVFTKIINMFIKDSSNSKMLYEFGHPMPFAVFLIRVYFRQFKYVLIGAPILSVIFIVFNKIYIAITCNKINKRPIKISFWLTIFVSLLALMLLNIRLLWFVLPITVIFTFYVLIVFYKIELKESLFYIFFGFLLMIGIMLGSTGGIRQMITSGGIFLIMPFMMAYISKNKKDLETKSLSFFRIITILFFCVILIFGVYKKLYDDGIRESGRKQLNVMFSSPSLFGIHSSKERVEVIDDIIKVINKKRKQSDSLVCFNSIPIMHYIMNIDYPLSDPWTVQQNLPKTKKEINVLLNNNDPNLILFSKHSAREKDWPKTSELYYVRDKEKYEYFKELVKYKYKNIYENKAFILYSIKK